MRLLLSGRRLLLKAKPLQEAHKSLYAPGLLKCRVLQIRRMRSRIIGSKEPGELPFARPLPIEILDDEWGIDRDNGIFHVRQSPRLSDGQP
jgi:hypothetical protein